MARPSSFMTRQADTWLTDVVQIDDQTDAVDVDPSTGAIVTTTDETNQWCALIAEIATDRQQSDGRTLGLADRMLYLTVDAMPEAGQRVTVIHCQGDITLVDRVGTITDVERDTIRARRRCTVRFDSGV